MRTTTAEMAWLRELCRSGEARRLRLAAQVALGEIAHDVEATATSVQRWETGKRVPRGDHALRYAAVLRQLQRMVRRAC